MDKPFGLEPNDRGDAAHLFYRDREHDTDAVNCWCKPRFYRVCMDCEDGCWKCSDGKNEITAEEAAFANEALLVVHN